MQIEKAKGWKGLIKFTFLKNKKESDRRTGNSGTPSSVQCRVRHKTRQMKVKRPVSKRHTQFSVLLQDPLAILCTRISPSVFLSGVIFYTLV
jgi:hypothetical protein